MRALTQLTFAGEAWRDCSTTEGPKVGASRTVLQIAVNLVFGTPFLWCLLIAVRGRVLWDSHRVFGDGIGRGSTLIWVMAAALGALWLGVSFLLTTVRARTFAGALLVLVASVLLVGFHP
jgi:uncharacterized membrane protein